MRLRPLSRAFGLILLADGGAALVSPRQYLRQLQTGTPLIDDLLEYFAQNPELTRNLSLLEIVAGLWFTLRP